LSIFAPHKKSKILQNIHKLFKFKCFEMSMTKIYVIFIKLCIKGDSFVQLKGNTPVRRINFRMKVGNAQKVYLYNNY
jgi:hypothetical protein